QQAAYPGDGPARLQADLGRLTAPLRIRWRQPGSRAAPVVRVKEAYLWDLRPEAATLNAVLQYAVEQGSVSGVTVEVPDWLEVLSVEVTAPDRPPRLADWQLAPGGHSLRAVFASPASGEFQLFVQCAPRRPLSPREPLPVLSPQGAAVESLLAF